MDIINKNFLISFLLIIIPLLNDACAGVLIEPYFGVTINSGGEAKINDQKVEYSFSSAAYGGRIGYQYFGLMGGLDYSVQNFTMAREAPGSAKKIDTKKNQLGVFIGYDFPLLIRAWGTFFALNKMDSLSETFKSNAGYELGLGLKSLPFVSLNIAYRRFYYDRYQTSIYGEYKEELASTEIFFYISAPLILFD